ncbi:hypothetical protein ACFOVU_04720 [Nocardiopsis sediminis]|uniref:Uncharacterized protein n=1 Tax=Nocardiopsis sediminis TaxID=1778267 RepID=A0ABV8FJG7_9ACTN
MSEAAPPGPTLERSPRLQLLSQLAATIRLIGGHALLSPAAEEFPVL